MPGPKILSTSAKVSDKHSLIVNVAVELDEPARVFVEYGNDEAGWHRSRTTPAEASKHVVSVLRLRPETAYEYRVYAVGSDGEASEGMGGAFTTGELPESIAAMKFESEGSAGFDLILMDIQEGGVDDTVGRMVVLDRDSQVVWYYDGAESQIRGIVQKSNYNLVFIEGGVGVSEINLFGDRVRLWETETRQGNSHHDLLLRTDTKVWFLSDRAARTKASDDPTREIPPGTLITGLALREWDQETDETRVVWDMFDDIPIGEIAAMLKETIDLREHRAHPNSLHMGPDGNLLISFRYINQIVSLAPDMESVEWRLGGPNSDFSFPDPTDKFYHQHQAIQLPNGNVLLFDNGNTRSPEEGGKYSRGLELALDFENMTARKVWEFRHDPDIYARAISGVDRLPNGNTLVNFGRSQDLVDMPIALSEVSPSGEVIWDMHMPAPPLRRRYRAQTLESLFGEISIDR